MLKSKILHVMLDEKFLDMAYRDFETVSPNTSIYTIPKEGNPLKYIKTFIPFECTINDYQKLFRENNIKAVVFHSLNPKFYPIFDILPNGIKTLWVGWGYDYYSTLLADHYENGLYLPNTVAAMHKAKNNFSLRNIIRKASTSYRIGFMNSLNKVFFSKKFINHSEIFNKINYFSPVLEIEFYLANTMRYDFSYIEWNYGNIHDDYLISDDKGCDNAQHILVGNSATPENNHIDMFINLINNYDIKDRYIYCPLSYGDLEYSKVVINMGNKLFGDRFKPLCNFLDKDEYFKILKSCGFIFMNQLRQQAVGNILSLLCNGSKLFLNKKNPLYSHLLNIGISVSEIDLNKRVDKIKLEYPSIEESRNNKLLVMKNWHRDKNLDLTRKLVNTLICD